mgnify:CR=1 FL=1
MVMHQIIPDNIQESPLNRPPKINHNTFPKKLITQSPFHIALINLCVIFSIVI